MEINSENNLKQIVKEINEITRKLNGFKLNIKIRNSIRQKRLNLVKKLISFPNFDKNKKCFLLPLVQPDLYISYNTAIVGNSKNLLYYNFGEEIDRHEDVIRFNYAHTEGFEEFCGNKTTIRICSLICLKGSRPKHHPKINNMNYKLYHQIRNTKLICFHKNPNKKEIVNEFNKVNNENQLNNQLFTILWNPKYFQEVSKFYGIKNGKAPQCGSGLMLLLTDLGLCPNVYGLDTKFCNDNYYYYWDIVNKKCSKLSTSHNYNWEFDIVNILNEKKYINLKTFNE